MNKRQFLSRLGRALKGLPEADIKERVAFYAEMIDDRVEEGMSEEEAVLAIGSVDEIREQIVSEIPLQRLVRERVKPKRSLGAWRVAALIAGFPLWFSLLAAAFAVLLSLYVTLWALIVALWAVEAAMCVCAACGVIASAVYFIEGEALPALMMLGAAFVLSGLAIFLFYGCVAATKGGARLAGRLGYGVKSMFIKKEN